jgi:hypothetical protein
MFHYHKDSREDTHLLHYKNYIIKNNTIVTPFVIKEKVHYVTRIESTDGTDHKVLFLAQQSGIQISFHLTKIKMKRTFL